MFKFSLFLVLFYAAVFGCGNALDYKCTPNETFQDACNTCKCSSDGLTAACTLASCVDSSTELPEVSTVTTEAAQAENQTKTTEATLEHIENNNHVCTPNDVKMQDCNRCRCAANGIGWFCTRRLCGNGSNGHQKRDVAVKSPESPECVPGKKWNDGCNDCFCTVNGIPACTLMLCSESEQRTSNYKNHRKRSLPIEPNCTPGTTWEQECNTCFCGDTGFAACTLKGCLKKDNIHNIRVHNASAALRNVSLAEYTAPDFSCEPSESFKLECNTCKCSADGKGATWCTKKRCVPYE